MAAHPDQKNPPIIVYPKSWGTLVFTEDQAQSKQVIDCYQDWISDERRMSLVKGDCIYMHPLPADRNIEVTDGVIDGPNSVVYDEAGTVCMYRKL